MNCSNFGQIKVKLGLTTNENINFDTKWWNLLKQDLACKTKQTKYSINWCIKALLAFKWFRALYTIKNLQLWHLELGWERVVYDFGRSYIHLAILSFEAFIIWSNCCCISHNLSSTLVVAFNLPVSWPSPYSFFFFWAGFGLHS